MLGMMANIFLLCAHKTLGGWQFGARYTVEDVYKRQVHPFG